MIAVQWPRGAHSYVNRGIEVLVSKKKKKIKVIGRLSNGFDWTKRSVRVLEFEERICDSYVKS